MLEGRPQAVTQKGNPLSYGFCNYLTRARRICDNYLTRGIAF